MERSSALRGDALPGEDGKVGPPILFSRYLSEKLVYVPNRDWADLYDHRRHSVPKRGRDDLVDSITQALNICAIGSCPE
jgi:phage terminase large subunit-like protein